MERITVTVDDGLLAQFDAYMKRNGYGNRSEAFRDIVREKLEGDRLTRGEAAHCVGCLTYVYDHHARELAGRLTREQHEHHDLSLSTLHVHLDHDTCLETTVLRGPTEAVRAFANTVIAQRGVRHGNLHIVPADLETSRHAHGGDVRTPHVHSRPKT